jgi:predicted nucleic acid-binding protein
VTVNDALARVSRLGVDTAPLVYYVEDHPAYADRVEAVFRRAASNGIYLCSTVVTLTEVLVVPKRAGRADLETAYRDLLLNNDNFALLSVDVAVAERAADLRARYSLKTPDAIQVATALENGCQAFLTNDAGLRRVADIRTLVLGELTA